MPNLHTTFAELTADDNKRLDLARDAIRKALPGVPAFSVFVFQEENNLALSAISNMCSEDICAILEACLNAYRKPASTTRN